MGNQEKLPGGLFDSSKQLQTFKHNFKITMYGRANLSQILHIITDKGIKEILTNSMLIDQADLKGARRKHSPGEKAATKNMHIALWNLFVYPFKIMIQIYANDNKTEGPTSLYKT
eukprot:3612740-Ditylum_brightwellii.AAC.1